MGLGFAYFCSYCQKEFTVFVGGGTMGHALFCELCGAAKSVSYHRRNALDSTLINALWHYPDELAPYRDEENDRFITQEKLPPSLLTIYNMYLDTLQPILRRKPCKCGGRWSPFAPAACPKCKARVGSEAVIKRSDLVVDWD